MGGVLALTFILGVVFLFEDVGAAWVMFGVTLFDVLLFKAVLPQRYQIFQNRLKIVLGGPFALNIPLSNIKDARPASSRKAFVYWGHRFATSSSGVVEIVRSRGMGVVISPANSDMFLKQLNQALKLVLNSG